MQLELVIAVDDAWGIGKDGDLPWHFREDLKNFAKLTKRAPKGTINALVMGRKTYLSLPKRPLPGRINFLMTTRDRGDVVNELCRMHEYDTHIDRYKKHKMYVINTLSQVRNLVVNLNKVFIAGGAEIYRFVIANYADLIDRVHLTRVQGTFDCDVSVPELEAFLTMFQVVDEVSFEGFTTFTYARR